VLTAEKDTYEKAEFYDLLEKEYDKCPWHDIKLIPSGLNAKIRVRRKLKTYYGYVQFTQSE
jgi:hypothetical protein